MNYLRFRPNLPSVKLPSVSLPLPQRVEGLHPLIKNLLLKSALALTFTVCLVAPDRTSASSPAAKKEDILLSTMQQELGRAHDSFAKLDPAPYFLSYSVQDRSMAVAVGSQGSLLNSTFGRRRSADVIIRIGTPALDNAHEENRASAISSGAIPLQDDRNAISRVLWRLSSENIGKLPAPTLM
jgi:hypothetical protein